MLDLRLIREQPEQIAQRLRHRGGDELLKPLLERDAERRRLIHEAEELKAERNRASEAIGQAKRRGEDATAEMARMRQMGEAIDALDRRVKAVELELDELQSWVPNLPHPSTPPGTSEVASTSASSSRWNT